MAVALLVGIVLAIRRWWRELGLIAIALSVEVLAAGPPRSPWIVPDPPCPGWIPRPSTSSYPSGHTAAAIALWVSLAIVISAHVRNSFGEDADL